MSSDSTFNFAINRLLEQQKPGSDDGSIDLSNPGPSSGGKNFGVINPMASPFSLPPFLHNPRQQGNPLFGNPGFMFPGLPLMNGSKKENKRDDDESSEPKSPESENEQKQEMNSPPWLNYLNIASQLVRGPSMIGGKSSSPLFSSIKLIIPI